MILAWFKYMRATRARLLYSWRRNVYYRVALKSSFVVSSRASPSFINFGFLRFALPRQSAGVRCWSSLKFILSRMHLMSFSHSFLSFLNLVVVLYYRAKLFLSTDTVLLWYWLVYTLHRQCSNLPNNIKESMYLYCWTPQPLKYLFLSVGERKMDEYNKLLLGSITWCEWIHFNRTLIIFKVSL